MKHRVTIKGTASIELRPSDWRCVICREPMSAADFARDEAVAMTGPDDDVVAHARHFGTAAGFAPEYAASVRTMAEAYIQRNPALKGAGA